MKEAGAELKHLLWGASIQWEMKSSGLFVV